MFSDNITDVISWTPCASSSTDATFDSGMLICSLPANFSVSAWYRADRAVYSFQLEVTRGGATGWANAGYAGPNLAFQTRGTGAKVGNKARSFLIKSPYFKRDGSAPYLASFFASNVYANISIVPAGRRRSIQAGNETTSGSCEITGYVNVLANEDTDLLACQLVGRVDDFLWASGVMQANIIAPGFGLNHTVSLGEIVPGPEVTETSTGKIIVTSGSDVTISGANFATGSYALSDNSVTLGGFYGGASASSCSIASATASAIVCSITQSISSPLGQFVTAIVTSWGQASNTTVVGIAVNPAQINIPRDTFNLSSTLININGTGLSDNPANNRARIYSNGNYTECTVLPDKSDKNTVACQLPNADLTSNSGQKLQARVYANGAWSSQAEGVVGGQLDQGTAVVGISVGVSVAVVAIIILIVLAIFLTRRQRKLRDIRGEMHQVPAKFASMFNVKTADLQIVKKLGEGSFGAVFLAKYKGQKDVAVKKLTSSMLAASVDGFFREAVRPPPPPRHSGQRVTIFF